MIKNKILAGHKISVSFKPRESASSGSFSLFNSPLLPGWHYLFNFFQDCHVLIMRISF